jgi:hypothetical protein
VHERSQLRVLLSISPERAGGSAGCGHQSRDHHLTTDQTVSQPVKHYNRSHAIFVTVDAPDTVVPNGVLIALGCALGDGLHVLDGQLLYVHNLYGRERYALHANELSGRVATTYDLALKPTEVEAGRRPCISMTRRWPRE